MSAPVERAVQVLVAAGFELLPRPVSVGGIPFSFSAMLASTRSLDLVVLIDTFESAPEEIARSEIAGLARVLDLKKSRRPLTVVLIGQRWSEVTERAMTHVARVLRCEVMLGNDVRDAAIRDALAVLLPLDLSPAPERPEESWSALRTELRGSVQDPELEATIAVASRGETQVKKALLQFLSAPLEAAGDD